jgi:hypothetical protein
MSKLKQIILQEVNKEGSANVIYIAFRIRFNNNMLEYSNSEIDIAFQELINDGYLIQTEKEFYYKVKEGM